MTDWWTELEGEILSCLERTGTTTPAEIGRRLGVPATAAASLLSILVREGKVRMCFVELAGRDVEAPAATAPRRGAA
jgi:DNA-binding Lrp family transcriptional regulator